MKSRLAVSFGGVADREMKNRGEEASGIRGARAPRRRVFRAFLGCLDFGPSPIGAPGWRVDGAFLGRLAPGPSPIRALGLVIRTPSTYEETRDRISSEEPL